MARYKNVFVPILLILCMLFGYFGTTYVLSRITKTYSFENSATVFSTSEGISVWNDSSCNFPLLFIDWGVIDVGGSKSFPFWLKNNSTTTLNTSLTTTNWEPTQAYQWISIFWDLEGITIPIGITAFTLSIAVSEQILGIDSFNVTIELRGVEPS